MLRVRVQSDDNDGAHIVDFYEHLARGAPQMREPKCFSCRHKNRPNFTSNRVAEITFNYFKHK